MKKLIVFCLVQFLFLSNSFSQQPAFITDSLDVYIERALKNWEIPGAAVLIVKDGKIVVSKGYGVRESGKPEKVDENTLFLIGSNTKAFTGTALAILEHEKKFKLEDKVNSYLPDFKMKDEWVTKNLNLVDIVSHRMGFGTFQGDFMYWTSDLTSDGVIEKFGNLEPMYDFRTKYGYTNAGYGVAGKIIEKVSGKTWNDFIKEKIFVPLDMKRSTPLSVDYAKSENIAVAHTNVNGKILPIEFQSLDNLAPCGSIGSSVKDLQGWIIAQLDSGRFNGKTVLPFDVIKRTRQPQTIIGRARHPFNAVNFSLYGLGWVLEDYEGREIVSHTGGVNGFVTSVTLLPKENLGIVVLTNTDQNAFYQMLKWEIIDSYLGLPYRNYDSYMFNRASKSIQKNKELLSALRDSVTMNIKPEFDESSIAGKYEHEVYGFAEIVPKENYYELKLQHHSNKSGKLEYIGNNRFLCTYSDPTYGIKVFPFEIEKGKVKSFDLYVVDFLESYPYKFVKTN